MGNQKKKTGLKEYKQLQLGCNPHLHNGGTHRQQFPTVMLSAGIEPVGMILHTIRVVHLDPYEVLEQGQTVHRSHAIAK